MEEFPTEMPAEAAAAVAAVMVVQLIISLGIYVYFAVCLMTIAKKTSTPNGWMAWIPILNLVLMLQMAKKPVWWIVLLFIPLVNIVWIVFYILAGMGIAEARGKPAWWGVLLIIPLVNLVILGMLAFSNGGKAEPAAS